MEIYKGIEIVDLGIYIKKNKVLVISDLQIGYEDSLGKEGIFVPKFQYELLKKRLNKIFERVKPNLTIINGDLKHEFGTINDQEWRETLAIIDLIYTHCNKIILIKGNHDLILEPIAKKRNIELVDYYKMDDILILHGHKVILEALGSKVIIIGHEHPAVSLKDGIKIEKYKCYLKGKYGKSNIIVMPSLNLLNEGSDVLRGEVLSPFLRKNLGDFEVYIVEDRVYKFGKIKNLK